MSSWHNILQKRRNWTKKRGTTDTYQRERKQKRKLYARERRLQEKIEQQNKPLVVTPMIHATGNTQTVITPTVITSNHGCRTVEAPPLYDPSEISLNEIPPIEIAPTKSSPEINVPVEISGTTTATINPDVITPTMMPQLEMVRINKILRFANSQL